MSDKTWYYVREYHTKVEGPVKAANEKEARKKLREGPFLQKYNIKKDNGEESIKIVVPTQLPRGLLIFNLQGDLIQEYNLLRNKTGIKKKKKEKKAIMIEDLY